MMKQASSQSLALQVVFEPIRGLLYPILISEQIMELQSKYQQADGKVQVLEQTERHLRTKLKQKEKVLEVGNAACSCL